MALSTFPSRQGSDHRPRILSQGRTGRDLFAQMIMATVAVLLVHCGGQRKTPGTSNAGGGSASAAGDTLSTGGTVGTGGVNTTGGVLGTGGVPTTGGVSPTGGVSSKGGVSSAGGILSTGGVSSTGGGSNTGGITSSGGSSGMGGSTSTGGITSTGGTPAGSFQLTSPEWTNVDGCGPTNKTVCSPLPAAITRSGAGTSPELHWTSAPAGTKSFVVLLQDLNNGTAHWILWNVPATTTLLPANIDQTTATPATPAGSQQCGKGTDAATTNGYYGPGAPCNVYEFVVYALSVPMFTPTNATDQESVRTQLQALGASILGTASLRGRTNSGC